MSTYFGFLVGLLLGCGGGSDPTHGDATPAPDDPSAELVSVRVSRDGVAEPNRRAVFLDSSSQVMADVQTDADGIASAPVPSGGSVSVVTDWAFTTDIRTFVGVEPGDQLVLDEAFPRSSYDILIPRSTVAASYQVRSSCSGRNVSAIPPPGGVEPFTVTTQGCVGTIDIVVTTFDDNNHVTGALHHSGAVVAANGTVDLTADNYAAVEQAEYHVDGVGASSTLAVTRVKNRAIAEATSTVVGGVAQFALPAVSGATQASVVVPDTTPAVCYFDWGPPSLMQTIDVTTRSLPELTNPRFDAGVARWDTSSDAEASFAVALLAVRSSNSLWLWSVLGPHEQRQLSLPTLPAGVAPFAIQAATEVTVTPVIGAITGGFASVRTDGRWLEPRLAGLTLGFENLLVPAAGTTGQATLSFSR